MKSKVLLLGRIAHANESWKAVSAIADIVEPRARERHDFIEQCVSGDFDGVSVIYRTFESVEISGCFDAELIAVLPKSVRFVCHNGAGYDQVNIEACSRRGIKVSHTPNVVDDSTADTAMFLILGALRQLNVPMTTLRSGTWRGHSLPALGHNPEGKILGILGMGGIGQNLRRKAGAFGMRVIYNNRRKLSSDRSGAAVYVSFEELLMQSDVISINLPLNTETRHIISKRQFELMKPGVVVVNTARGAIIDEDALVEALNSGKVACAGLDVYEHEPHVHPDLIGNPNVILLPHMGTWSFETQAAMEEKTISNVRSALERGSVVNIVPEQAAADAKRNGTSYLKGGQKR